MVFSKKFMKKKVRKYDPVIIQSLPKRKKIYFHLFFMHWDSPKKRIKSNKINLAGKSLNGPFLLAKRATIWLLDPQADTAVMKGMIALAPANHACHVFIVDRVFLWFRLTSETIVHDLRGKIPSGSHKKHPAESSPEHDKLRMCLMSNPMTSRRQHSISSM